MQPKFPEIYNLAQAGLEGLCQPLDAGITGMNHQAQPPGQLKVLMTKNIHFTKKVQLGVGEMTQG